MGSSSIPSQQHPHLTSATGHDLPPQGRTGTSPFYHSRLAATYPAFRRLHSHSNHWCCETACPAIRHRRRGGDPAAVHDALEGLLSAIERYKIAEVQVVPPTITRLVNDPLVDQYDLPCISRFASGAAPISKPRQTLSPSLPPSIEASSSSCCGGSRQQQLEERETGSAEERLMRYVRERKGRGEEASGSTLSGGRSQEREWDDTETGVAGGVSGRGDAHSEAVEQYVLAMPMAQLASLSGGHSRRDGCVVVASASDAVDIRTHTSTSRCPARRRCLGLRKCQTPISAAFFLSCLSSHADWAAPSGAPRRGVSYRTPTATRT